MILCDTTLIIDVLNEEVSAKQFLLSWPPDELAISVITEWEVLQGARDKGEHDAFRKALRRYHIIELDTLISDHAGILLKTYQLSHSLQIPDALIAATAIKYVLPLKTSNVKDFKYIQGLTLLEE